MRAFSLALFATIFVPAAANAQRLWSIVEAPPNLPPLPNGSTAGMVAYGVGPESSPLAEAVPVQVDFDRLRRGFGFLELPLPDGSVIEAENAAFEDRGGGNLTWTGEVPGTGVESALFTVQNGHLIGWFGEPGGPKRVVHAGPDGRGALTRATGPTGDWCGVAPAPRRDAARGGQPAPRARRASPPSASPSAADAGNRLDILVLYPGGTERHWRPIGGAAAGIQQLSDYLNMAFRNGALPAQANLIPARWAPEVYANPWTQGGHFDDRGPAGGLWHEGFRSSAAVERLRGLHAPDLIHFMPPAGTSRAAGAAGLRGDLNPQVLTGWSAPNNAVFAHEIGHNLGGHHEPATFGERFQEARTETLRPYGFGHTDLSSCRERRDPVVHVVCPKTLLSYGEELANDPRLAVAEPWYSSVRLRPNGWTIGIAGERENERVLRETLPVATRSDEAVRLTEQYPRRIAARWTGRDTVRVTWPEPIVGQTGAVQVGWAEGANDFYLWNPPGIGAASSANVEPILEPGGAAQTGIEMAGLRPGGRYRIAVKGPWRRTGQGILWPLYSDAVEVMPPAAAAGAPAAPSDVGAQTTGLDRARLHWQADSGGQTGFEIWGRKWSGKAPDRVWRRHGALLPSSARSAEIEGLVAEEEIEVTETWWDEARGETVAGERAKVGRYSFVVVATNDRGFRASDTFHLEFMPGPPPAPTPAGEVTDCSLLDRSAGVDLDGYRVDACIEAPDGSRRRAWDYDLEAEQSGILYFFGRDNAEILVKVLDGCAINGHRWVFIAPVTDLSFRLQIVAPGPEGAGGRRRWLYDAERRSQDAIRQAGVRVGNPKGTTARAVSDTTAFPCTAAETAAGTASSRLGLEGAAGGASSALIPAFASVHASAFSARRLADGVNTDCTPDAPALTLRGGYQVGMCYETREGRVGHARNWGLDSSRSALLHFFDRDNAEVLLKVLDGCGVNGHHWVFVAPVTDLAFNLRVTSPDGQVWTHANRLGRTADTRSDIAAFPCSTAA